MQKTTEKGGRTINIPYAKTETFTTTPDGWILAKYIAEEWERAGRRVVVAKSKNAITVSSTFTSCISDYTGEEE